MISNKIKTIYSKGLLVMGLLAMVTSCDEALDLQPETTWAAEEFYANENDINAALAGIHSSISSGNSFGNQIMLMYPGTDESYKLKDWNERNPVSINAHNSNSEGVIHAWQNLYAGINNANNLIKYINPDNFENEADFNKFLAEGRFLRGFMYYHLTCWYNEIPLRLEPIKDQSSNNMAPSPVEDVYEQIIDDLTFAAENLPSSFDAGYNIGHANSGAAHAMLAKVYLKAAGYPLRATEINGKNPYQGAKEHCRVIMEDLGHDLNSGYKEVFVNFIQNKYDLKESIFEIVYRNAVDLGINIGGRNGFVNGLFYNIRTSKVGEPGTSPEVSPSPVHDYIYEDGDTRKAWNIPGYGGVKNQWNPNGRVNAQAHSLAWGWTPGKFRRWDAAYPDDLDKTNEQLQPIITLETPQPVHQAITGINIPLIRFSDVLLMFAEAENELNGPTAAAQSAIDKVRNRAGLDNLATAKPDAIAGKTAFFDEIVDERLRELCFEGHRKHDLIRWGLLEEKLNVLYNSITQHPEYTPSLYLRYRAYSNFDPSKHLSLPYPQQEVLLNNLLDQKPEWE
ncbi:RagB/SusD family nutrient uptake outer membrane protein [Algibacter mikhailovii]|uniref:Starch-binding protein n=1 Tax=Algibacter mikhailovii TaxID=425498 RepID=A0A918R865_9FLAO|nr:RagB/SusD family nutrient uptake outer membrane protein [Algibacter mikhailovii]GGZ87328.1 starch-binding protein [Algibacter mikhailovii]